MKCPRCNGDGLQGGGRFRYCPRCRWTNKDKSPGVELGTTRLGEHPKRKPDGTLDVDAEQEAVESELKRVGLKP